MSKPAITRLTCTTHGVFMVFPHSDPEWAEKHDAWQVQHEDTHLNDAEPCEWESRDEEVQS